MLKAPKSNEQDFTPAPEANHQGILVDIVNLGMVKGDWKGKTTWKWKVRFRWQINELITEGDYAGERFIVSQRYTMSSHSKSNLRKDLKAALGPQWKKVEKQFEAGEFDLEVLIGKLNAMINVVHNESDGTIYANIEGVAQLPKGMKKLKVADNYVRMCDREDWEEPSMETGSKKAKGEAPADDDEFEADDGMPWTDEGDEKEEEEGVLEL